MATNIASIHINIALLSKLLVIGTPSAIPLLQENFRHARRANGLGSLNWDRLLPGRTWDHFIEQLWQYQWTQEVTPISQEIRNVLYDESQGVMDVVVKLFMLAQIRLVGISEVRDSPEIITEQLLRKVALEDFSMVAPMIEALRKNDKKALQKFDDLRPLQEHINQVMATALLSHPIPADSPTSVEVAPAETETETETETADDNISKVRASLSNLGVSEDIIAVVINEALRIHPSGDVFLMMSEASRLLSAQPTKKNKPKSKPVESVPRPVLDLRDIVSNKVEAQTAYDALLAANLIKLPNLELVA